MSATETTIEEAEKRPIVDFKAVLDAKFSTGEGMLVLSPSMSDVEIVHAVRMAMTHGASFRVIPG